MYRQLKYKMGRIKMIQIEIKHNSYTEYNYGVFLRVDTGLEEIKRHTMFIDSLNHAKQLQKELAGAKIKLSKEMLELYFNTELIISD